MRFAVVCALFLLPAVSSLARVPSGVRADLATYKRTVIDLNTADQAAARAALVTLSERREDGALKFAELAAGYEAKILPRYQAIVTRLRDAKPRTREVQELNRSLAAS